MGYSRTTDSQWLRSAFISSDLFIFDRPSIPISPARLRSSSTVQSSYEPDLPPLRLTAFREVFAAALAIRAAFSRLPPCSRTFS